MFSKKNKISLNDFEFHIKNIQLLFNNKTTTISYLRVLTDMIQNQQLGYCFHYINNNLGLDKNSNNIPHYYDYIKAFGKTENSKIYDLKDSIIEVDLSKDPIISCIWECSRVKSALENIGDGCILSYSNKENIFKYDRSNHYVTHIYPLGINVVSNGNHSIFSGIIKRKGIVKITSIIDISNSFPTISYNQNGLSVDRKQSKDIPLQSIKEIGIIYEIGKLMKESNQEYIYPQIEEFIRLNKK
ncbi:MAG: DUF6710 family protein [Beduini sp.]|uniref:DUF6710 family protein n=1 Tax=Beduini sp. TaxID=1922300 RepID=UPI0011CA634C